MLRRTCLALSASLLLVACGDDTTPTAGSGAPAASPAPATEPAPAAPAPAESASAAEPPFEADTSVDQREPSGGRLSVTTVRVARQDGYDRVVFELDGKEPGEPGWRVEYSDSPSRQGSGESVDLEGEATLVVLIEGVGYPFDTGVEEQPGAPSVPGDVEVVQEVEPGSVFEGVHEAFIGTSRKAPFRVFRLADPARVVVDVRHD